MSIVKKWASSVVSLIAGVLALVLSVCSGMVVKAAIAGKTVFTETTKAYEVITDSDLMDTAKLLQLEDKFSTLRILSIIMMVVAALLLVYSIILILKNLNVIKSSSKVFSYVNVVLSVLLLVFTIAVLIATNSYASALADKLAVIQFGGVASVKASIGSYQWIMLIVSIVATLVSCIAVFCVKKTRKSKKSK